MDIARMTEILKTGVLVFLGVISIVVSVVIVVVKDLIVKAEIASAEEDIYGMR